MPAATSQQAFEGGNRLYGSCTLYRKTTQLRRAKRIISRAPRQPQTSPATTTYPALPDPNRCLRAPPRSLFAYSRCSRVGSHRAAPGPRACRHRQYRDLARARETALPRLLPIAVPPQDANLRAPALPALCASFLLERQTDRGSRSRPGGVFQLDAIHRLAASHSQLAAPARLPALSSPRPATSRATVSPRTAERTPIADHPRSS